MPTPPDVIRCAYAELVVTDLAKSKWFYTDVLGLVVTAEDDDAVYLRAFEEYLHHSLVLRKGEVAACARLAYRVRAPRELDRAEAYYRALGVRVERVPAGRCRGIGEAVRIEDPLGFPIEFFYDAEHVERLTQRYDLHGAGAISRLDHLNIVVPDVPAGQKYYEGLGFRVSEDIEDAEGTVYAAWMFRKPDVHDNQRRDWWGNPVVPSWYSEASTVLDLDGRPKPVTARTEAREADVTIGADGFSYTRAEDTGGELRGFKVGHQV